MSGGAVQVGRVWMTSLQRVAVRVVPDPFVFALGLTAVAASLAMLVMVSEPESGVGIAASRAVRGWLTGFTDPGGFAFALQMALVLVSGHALASSRPIRTVIGAVASRAGSARGASALVAAGACVASLFHWGVGAVAGALLAREVARRCRSRGVRVHYAILGAAGYSGFAVWHGGLSGSAPLKVAEPGHFAASTIGVLPLSETLGGAANLVITGALCVAIPLLFWWVTPANPREEDGPGDRLSESATESPRAVGFGAGPLVGLVLLAVVATGYVQGSLRFDLNGVIVLFVCLGLLLTERVGDYVDRVTEGARGAGGIILQFPFYFGVIGIMKESGLIALASDALVSMSNAAVYPVVAFMAAGLVNLFVPSGGGQWAVQGEILLRAGSALGVDPTLTVMAFSYGDAWTNMLQPFWALPLLGLMGLRAHEVIGYTSLVFLCMGVVVPIGLLAMVQVG